MVEPFAVTVKLIKGLLGCLNEVKTNHEECQLLGRLAKRTLVLMSEFQGRFVAKHCVSEALSCVNEALKGAQAAIDDCCNTNCLCAMLLYKTHSSALKQAAKELDHALFQIPLAALGMTLDIQDDLASLVDGRSHEKFGERASRAYQTSALNAKIEESYVQTIHAIEGASAQTNQEIIEASLRTSQEVEEVVSQTNQKFENIKDQIEQMMQKLGLHSEATGVLTPTANLVNDISNVVKNAKTNKEECNQLAIFVERVLGHLKMSGDKALSHSLVMVVLTQVNEALATVKQSINDCCATNVFLGTFYQQSYSSRLQEAMKELGNALSQILCKVEGIPANIQSALSEVCNEILYVGFTRKVATNTPRVSLQNEQPSDNVEESKPNQDNMIAASESTQDNNVEDPNPTQDNNVEDPNPTQDNNVEDPNTTQDNNVEDPNPTQDNNVEDPNTTQDNNVEDPNTTQDNNVEDPNPTQDDNGQSSLYVASNNSVDELVDKGTIANLQDNASWTSLHIASHGNSIDITTELIAYDKNVNIQDKNGWTPLHHAVQQNYVNNVKVKLVPHLRESKPIQELIAIGANVDIQDNDGLTPLYIASQNNHIEIVKVDSFLHIYKSSLVYVLIARGANVNLPSKRKPFLWNIVLRNNQGWTPLHVASCTNRIYVLKELTSNGAIVDVQDICGLTPLHVASRNNHSGIVKELIASGATIDVQNKFRWTPLHIASSCGQITIAKILLEHGASKKVRNAGRQKPYHVVCSDGSCGPYAKATIKELKSLLKR